MDWQNRSAECEFFIGDAERRGTILPVHFSEKGVADVEIGLDRLNGQFVQSRGQGRIRGKQDFILYLSVRSK